MADTREVLKIIHGSFTRKFGDLLILSKAHKKFISDQVEDGEDQSAVTVLVAWLGYLWDCEYQDDWDTTKLKAHRFVTNYDGCSARGKRMLPFTYRKVKNARGEYTEFWPWCNAGSLACPGT